MTAPEHETEIKLEYETAPFLHSLFANDSRELKYLEEKLGVRSVTRDGWILFAGPERGVKASAAVFADLEQARRQGGVIGARDFRLAVDLVAAEREDFRTARRRDAMPWEAHRRDFRGGQTGVGQALQGVVA